MTLEERIIGLFRAGDEGSLFLGATILNSIGDLKEEIRIFDLGASQKVRETKSQVFISYRYYIYPIDMDVHPTNIKSDRWVLYRNFSNLYMLTENWIPTRAKNYLLNNKNEENV